MTTRTFAFAGQMGSGKDTAANFLSASVIKEGDIAKNYMFAQHLKQIAVDLFDCTEDQAFGDNKEVPFPDGPRIFDAAAAEEVYIWVKFRNQEYGPECLEKCLALAKKLSSPQFETPRTLLQFLGTEVLRDCFTPDYHLRQVEHQISIDNPDVAIVTDARFQNERDWARDFGASLVLITGRAREQFNTFKKHASETGLGDQSEYDFIVDNTGTLEDLENNVVAACRNMLP